MANTSQVFQTSSPRRWERFKWVLRICLIIFLFFLFVLAIVLIKGTNPSIPRLESVAYENQLGSSGSTRSGLNKRYKGFKAFLNKKIKEDSLRNLRNNSSDSNNKSPYIRAAFYTPWTTRTSLPSLKRYGAKLNTVFPEWFFIDTSTFTLQSRIDTAGLALMRAKNIRILPVLSNFHSGRKIFDTRLLRNIFLDNSKCQAFIKQIRDTLAHYHFQGINLDLEEMDKRTMEMLPVFEKALHQELHALNMTVTTDVDVMDEDYDYKKLAENNDYLVLMAYDEHTRLTEPGPISSQKWIEASLDWMARRIDPEKIILGFAGYGHDWYKTDEGKDTADDLTYEDAINLAKRVNAVIDYDNSNYNLHFSYVEVRFNNSIDNKDGVTRVKHEVWFTDGATIFNILRFSDEYATAGTTLWRMGAEDPRMWIFYNRDLSNDALQANPFNFALMEHVGILDDNVSFKGDGEILNIISSPQTGKINLEVDSTELLISEQRYVQLPAGYIIQRFAEDTVKPGPGHKLILTFDDGPDAEWTPQILDILEKYKVPATFFMVGIQIEKNIPLLQRIYKSGYEIGNHTFTHSNVATMSIERAGLEMQLTRLLIESITGRSTILFRAPYNADSEPQTYEELEPIVRSRQDNYLTIGESIDPRDWEPGVVADSIVARVITQVEERSASIILLHDAGGETREETVKALPRIIEYFLKRGYKFTTVADLMGKTRDEIMPLLPKNQHGFLVKLNFFFAEATYWGSHILFALFMVGIFLSISRMILMAVLASIQRKKEHAATTNIAPATASVTVIIPAYNEEVNSVRTIKSILQQNYPSLQVIFVDDGSKDATYNTVREAFKNIDTVHVYTKINGGKASALNVGIEKATTEFVVCIDADTQLKEDAISKLMEKCADSQVGAVAGNVKVGNEINMITYWQSIEYITSQNFDRRAFDLLNCITVVPGAIGAFRKDAVIAAGGFTSDTLAEDCDLTMRLLRKGYMVRNCTEAISYTEAPETMQQFLKQRFRWSFGVIQCFWKHRDAVLNPKYKNFGMVALPNILIFQMLLPILAPLADLLLVFSLIAAGFSIIPASIPHIILYYVIFTLVDVAGAALAFAFEKEDYKKLIWLIPQRLIYRQLMYYILLKSFSRALKGELQGWGALKRTGNVKQVAST